MKVAIAGIYDIHCHIIYDVDDGSKNLEMSMNMADMAYAEGVRRIIATPHFHKEWWDTPQEKIKKNFEELKKNIEEKYPDMKLYLGNEIRVHSDTIEELPQKGAFTMADSRYVLLEFADEDSYTYIVNNVRTAINKGYIPIIAHVERYMNVVGHEDRIEELINFGAYIQVNAESVTGESGKAVKKFIKQLLKNREVHFVATDSHRDNKRLPKIKAAADYIAKKFGEDYAREILINNPRCVIDDIYLDE